MRRHVGRLAAALALTGGVVLGFGAPASAQPSTVEFTNRCGGVEIAIPGAEGKAVTITRNGGTVVSWPSLQDDGPRIYGGTSGDVFAVTVGDKAPQTHTLTSPEGCVPPPVSLSLEPICQGIILLHMKNSGSRPVEGFTLAYGDEEVALPLPPGEDEQILFAAGVDISVRGPVSGAEEDTALWLVASPYTEPEGCGPKSVTVQFTDSCDKTTVTITSTVKAKQLYLVVRNPQEEPLSEEDPDPVVGVGFVSASAPATHQSPAVTGDRFVAFYPHFTFDVERARKAFAKTRSLRGPAALRTLIDEPGLLEIGEHTYTKPATCGAAGDLPVTGFQAGVAGLAGAGLLGVGAALFLVARRRRIRFANPS